MKSAKHSTNIFLDKLHSTAGLGSADFALVLWNKESTLPQPNMDANTLFVHHIQYILVNICLIV